MKKILCLIVALIAIPVFAYAAAGTVATVDGASRTNAAIQVDGKTVTNGVAFVYDNSGNILMGSGSTVPADAVTGYAKGALWFKTGVATTNSGLYENAGTATSTLFKLMGTTGVQDKISSVTLTIPAVSTTAVTGNDATLVGGTIIGFYPVSGDGFLNSLSMDALGNITGVVNAADNDYPTTWKVTVLVP